MTVKLQWAVVNNKEVCDDTINIKKAANKDEYLCNESDNIMMSGVLDQQSVNHIYIPNVCNKPYQYLKCFEEPMENGEKCEVLSHCGVPMNFRCFLDNNKPGFGKNTFNNDTVSTITINLPDTQQISPTSNNPSDSLSTTSLQKQNSQEQPDKLLTVSNISNKTDTCIAENHIPCLEECSINNLSKTELSCRNVTSTTLDAYESSATNEHVKWIDTIRQKRGLKHKKKVDDESDNVCVGTRIGEDHVNYVTAYNMLTGIRVGVSRCTAKVDRDLTSADFIDSYKFSFDITGNELTPSAKYDFKFKDYSPWVFRHLRALFRLDPADYLMSLTSKYILSELGSPGKSGSFFYFSRDYRYIIKTIHHSEHKFLRKILKQYYEHVKKNPNTLISQFYGLHRVKMPYGHKIHFVIMNNLFPPHRDIHKTFDLKGSTVGRDYKEDDLEKNPRATMKDLNWIRRNMYLSLGPKKRDIFLAQVKADIELLASLNIMDYSLLVGIHDLSLGNKEHIRDNILSVFNPNSEQIYNSLKHGQSASSVSELRKIVSTTGPVSLNSTSDELLETDFTLRKNFIFYSDDGGFRATQEDDLPGDSIYYLGIIDLLTKYSVIKKIEHFWKGLSYSKAQVSTIPPSGYASRFFKFISSIIKTPQSVEKQKN
ncbi:hypothetical protein PORY_001821 [Pneumocystis oryctolagi]|uniref:Uncharacterized protein n=1 Tax=Pneumocystis oryctolagi TaxID=42067 RepID=A0ACB7CB31_9ASCO|nr:hypothetical protein PORY_001821 [Pneumocystis oryctolagi]